MKSVGEPMSIAFDRLIESKRGNAIDFCQVAIQHHSHAADCADHSVNLLYCDRGFSFLRHRRERLFKNSSEEKREERMKEELRGRRRKVRRKNYEVRHGESVRWRRRRKKRIAECGLTRDLPISRSPHHATNAVYPAASPHAVLRNWFSGR